MKPDTIISAKQLRLEVKTEADKILGAPVGTNLKSVQSLALDIANKYSKLFKNLQNDKLPGFATDQILRMCAPPPSLNYLTSVVPPHFLENVATTFDSWSQNPFLMKKYRRNTLFNVVTIGHSPINGRNEFETALSTL